MKLTDIQKAFCINLDRRPERWENFKTVTEGIFPFAVERYSAYDGDNDEPPPRQWGARTKGGWGCLMSHWKLIEREYNAGTESLLIFEDDAYPVYGAEETKSILEQAIEELPSDWEQVYFGQQLLHSYKHKPIKYSDHLIIPYNANRTHVYMLSRSGMQKAIEKCQSWRSWKSGWHIDWAYGDLHENKLINVFCINPVLFGQDDWVSDIEPPNCSKNLGKRDWGMFNLEDLTFNCGRVYSYKVGYGKLKLDAWTKFDTDIYSAIHAHAESELKINITEDCEVFAYHFDDEGSWTDINAVIDGDSIGTVKERGDCTQTTIVTKGNHTFQFLTDDARAAHTYWVFRPLSVLPYKDGYGVEILTNAICPRNCAYCNQELFMKENPAYQYTTENANELLNALKRKVDIILSGGEPKFWDNVFDVLPMLRSSSKVGKIKVTTSQDDEEWICKLLEYVDKIHLSYRSSMDWALNDIPVHLQDERIEIWNQERHFAYPEVPDKNAPQCCCRNAGVSVAVFGNKVIPCVPAINMMLRGHKVAEMIDIKDYFSGKKSFAPIGNYKACRVCVNNISYQKEADGIPTE